MRQWPHFCGPTPADLWESFKVLREVWIVLSTAEYCPGPAHWRPPGWHCQRGACSSHWHSYCTVLYCTVLYCTVLYCTVLYCTVLYCTVLYCIVLYCIVLYCTVLYFTVLASAISGPRSYTPTLISLEIFTVFQMLQRALFASAPS